jgi:hypothetical protein
MKDKKSKNDLILIGAILAVVLIFGACLLLFRSEGDMVVVSVNGEEYATYPLGKDTVVDIRTGENGERFNRLVIKDGKAYVEDANCPGGKGDRCTVHAPISYDWESIICAPHKVTIAVKSAK